MSFHKTYIYRILMSYCIYDKQVLLLFAVYWNIYKTVLQLSLVVFVVVLSLKVQTCSVLLYNEFFCFSFLTMSSLPTCCLITGSSLTFCLKTLAKLLSSSRLFVIIQETKNGLLKKRYDPKNEKNILGQSKITFV